MTEVLDMSAVLAKHKIPLGEPSPMLVKRVLDQFESIVAKLTDQKESAESDEATKLLSTQVEKLSKDETLANLRDKVTAEIRAIVNEAIFTNEQVSYLLYGALSEVQSEVKQERDFLRAKTNATTKSTGIPATWSADKKDAQDLKEVLNAMTDYLAKWKGTSIESLAKVLKVSLVDAPRGDGKNLKVTRIPRDPNDGTSSTRPVTSRFLRYRIDGEEFPDEMLVDSAHRCEVTVREFLQAVETFGGRDDSVIFPVNGHYVQSFKV